MCNEREQKDASIPTQEANVQAQLVKPITCKKLFISQPMRDKTNEQIEEERERAIRAASEAIGEPVMVIDSFFKNAPHDAKPLWYLSKSLELMSQCDVVYFVSGWKNYRGCKIENTCAHEYLKSFGVRIIEEL